MRRWLPLPLLLLWLIGFTAHAADAERRVALVIGNEAYRAIGTLSNPAHDAQVIAAALKDAGFEIIGGKALVDLDKPAMEGAIRMFGRRLEGGAVGLFYYSGHGMQVADRNYLIPVEAAPRSLADTDFELIGVDVVMKQVALGGGRLSMIILDACRNNPFARSNTRAPDGGLAPMDAAGGTIISYATAPGKTAADGPRGTNSPYAKALAKAIREPGLGVLDAFNQVGLAVERETGGKQQPWLAISPVRGQFHFTSGTPAAAAVPATDAEVLFWQTIVSSTKPGDFAAYLKQYPHGRFADLARNRLDAGASAAAAPTGIEELLAQASTAEDAKDYDRALRLYRVAADRGNARAQFNVGYFYRKGFGVTADAAQAAIWYRKAADQGYATAQNNLGFLYSAGEGVPRDPMQAHHWYQKAAEQGNASAQNNLGWMYLRGEGMTKDTAQARFWFEKAAAQGNRNAQDALAQLARK